MLRFITRIFQTLTTRERILFCAAAGIFVGALIVFLWMTFISSTTLQPARGGEYTEGVVGQPTAINPMLIGSSSADKDLVEVLFADLLTLSKTVATSTSGKVWIVTLKEDMVWSDGKAITADDVVFTVHTIQNPDAGSPLRESWQGITVERVSQIEVRFTLKAAYSYFSDHLKNLRIAPAHVFESIPVSNIRLSNYNLEPVGSGPYTFLSYEKERSGFISTYHLAANNDFPGPRALIENINIRFFPTYNDAIIAFNRKSIDGLGGFDPVSLPDLKINHRVYELAMPHYYALFLNGSENVVLKDKNVREALTLATDKEMIVREVFNNRARVIQGPLAPEIPGYAASVYETSHFSSDEAIALLEKQQWKIGSDGIRTKTAGRTVQKLDFELTVPDITFLKETAELIKEQWQKIGVRVTVKTLSSDEVLEDAIKPRKYQILLFGNILRGNSDLFSFWHSSQRFQPGLNLALYQNTFVDQQIELARKTFDEAVKLTALAEIQQQLDVNKPAIFLFSPTYLYAAPTSLGGFSAKGGELIASPEDRLIKVNEWFLERSRVFKY